MRKNLIGVLLMLGLCCSAPAQATTWRWSLTGEVGASLGGNGGALLTSLYPPGTPFSMIFAADTFATNYAVDPTTHGLYLLPGGQLTIRGQTFSSSLTAFEINCPAASCGPGPGVPQEFNPFSPNTIIRLVGFGAAPFDAISLVDAEGGLITAGCVICFEGVRWEVTSYSVAAIPEPISVLLVGTGLAGALLRRRRSGYSLSVRGQAR